MAIGDKIYLADKPTQDQIKAGVDDANASLSTVDTRISNVQSNVGNTGDTVGSSTTGSIFGKLNSLLTSMANHLAVWSSARATKIDNISTAVANSNVANATGTLSQKLSHIIGLFAGVTPKVLVSKSALKRWSVAATNSFVYASGAGVFHRLYLSHIDPAYVTDVRIAIDGKSYSLSGYSGDAAAYIARDRTGVIGIIPATSEEADHTLPLYFKTSLSITVITASTTLVTAKAAYDVYE